MLEMYNIVLAIHCPRIQTQIINITYVFLNIYATFNSKNFVPAIEFFNSFQLDFTFFVNTMYV